MMTFKVQRAEGTHVELNHSDLIEWHDFIYGGSMDFAAAKRELVDAIRNSRDCDDEECEELYTAAIDDLAMKTPEDFFRDGGIMIKVEGREKAWRIVIDEA